MLNRVLNVLLKDNTKGYRTACGGFSELKVHIDGVKTFVAIYPQQNEKKSCIVYFMIRKFLTNKQLLSYLCALKQGAISKRLRRIEKTAHKQTEEERVHQPSSATIAAVPINLVEDLCKDLELRAHKIQLV